MDCGFRDTNGSRYRQADDATWNGWLQAHVMHTQLQFETAKRLFPEYLPDLAQLNHDVAEAIRLGKPLYTDWQSMSYGRIVFS